uniref:Pro-opiomelanocortin n=1 Tax=Loxodonta africana TaxID=9785 RepID=G3U7D5_LOXAF
MPRSCCSCSGVLLLALLLQVSMEVRGWCLESSQCQDLTTESNLLPCTKPARQFPKSPPEGKAFPGALKSPPSQAAPSRSPQCMWERLSQTHRFHVGGGSPGDSVSSSSERLRLPRGMAPWPESGPREGKRSYMEHFRWGKPVGKKRRPVKYPNGAEGESAEAFPLEFKREHEGAATQADLDNGLVAEVEATSAEKKDEGPYKMEHFRWGSPAKDKRYGGFMTSEKSQTPLVTLFKNAIIKNAYKKGH